MHNAGRVAPAVSQGVRKQASAVDFPVLSDPHTTIKRPES
jgi:hypothetical protein